MEDLLERLELRIRGMIDQQDHLRQSNLHLESTKGSLSKEKELLLARQQKAILQIESLVSRLKSIEKVS